MTSRILNILSIAALLFFGTLLIFAIPSFYNPQFEVINNSSDTVSVIALWRTNKKDLGSIEPTSSKVFIIDDEAAIQFEVHYNDGKVLTSDAKYFTRGVKIIAAISADEIAVYYDFEQKN